MVRNCATRPGELIINPQTKPYVDWMRFGVSAFLTEFEFPFLNLGRSCGVLCWLAANNLARSLLYSLVLVAPVFRVSLESSAYEPVSESG